MQKYQARESYYGQCVIEDAQGNFLTIDDVTMRLSEDKAERIAAILNEEEEP